MARARGYDDHELKALLARPATSTAPPPRAPPSASARREPLPTPTTEDPGEKPAEAPAVSPPRVTATLDPACGGGPPMHHAPASRRRVQAPPPPPPPPQRHEVGSSAAALQPRNRADLVVPRAQQPTAGGHAAAGRGKYWEDSYQIALRSRYLYVPDSVKLPREASLHPYQPCSMKQKSKALEREEKDKENPHECINKIKKSHVSNSSQPITGCYISNPVEHEIADSVAAFATKKTDEVEVIRDALMVQPKGSRSMFSKVPREKPAEAPTVSPPCTAPPPRVAAVLDPVCGGGPPMPHAPASRRRVQMLPKPQQHEVGSSAVALQPCNCMDVVVPRAQQPTTHAAAGGHAASGCGKYWEDLYQTALRTRYLYVPDSVKLPTEAYLHPDQPYTVKKKPKALQHREEKEKEKENLHECINKIKKSHVSNSSQPITGCYISNPVEHEIADSVAAFATKKTDEVEVIRDALMVQPKGSRSMLYIDQSFGGCDCGDNGTNTKASIHSNGKGSKSFEVAFAVGHELARYGLIKSEPWSAIGRQQPLILHDVDIVQALGNGGQVDVMQAITSTLQNHPGPVKHFRVDSSQIPKGREQLEEWFALLRKKGVEEVVLVNSRWPNDMMEFPINDLDCESISQLRLCFFRISDIVLTSIDNLTTIDFCCCSISTQDLTALVDQSKSLKELSIGYFEGDAIRISSKSLEILLIWQSTVKRIAIQTASKLRRVLLTARSKISDVGVWINCAPILTDLWINLSTQSVTINSIFLKTDNSPLPSIKRLVLNISLLVWKERKTLLNFVKSCTQLKELLSGNDARSDEELFHVINDDWTAEFKNLSCLKLHLEVFNIKSFRGGDSEVAIASAVLEHACCLKQLNLETDDNGSEDGVFDRARLDLHMIVRASASATVNYMTGPSDGDRFFFEGV